MLFFTEFRLHEDYPFFPSTFPPYVIAVNSPFSTISRGRNPASRLFYLKRKST